MEDIGVRGAGRGIDGERGRGKGMLCRMAFNIKGEFARGAQESIGLVWPGRKQLQEATGCFGRYEGADGEGLGEEVPEHQGRPHI